MATRAELLAREAVSGLYGLANSPLGEAGPMLQRAGNPFELGKYLLGEDPELSAIEENQRIKSRSGPPKSRTIDRNLRTDELDLAEQQFNQDPEAYYNSLRGSTPEGLTPEQWSQALSQPQEQREYEERTKGMSMAGPGVAFRAEDPNRVGPPRGGSVSMMQISGNTPGAERLEAESIQKEIAMEELRRRAEFAKMPLAQRQQLSQANPSAQRLGAHRQLFGDQDSYIRQAEAELTTDPRFQALSPQAKAQALSLKRSRALQAYQASGAEMVIGRYDQPF